MEFRQICRNLFYQNGQIGYYLLGCQVERKEEEQDGAVPACERGCSAKQRL